VFRLVCIFPKLPDASRSDIQNLLGRYSLTTYPQKPFHANPEYGSNNRNRNDLGVLNKHLHNNFDSFGNQLHTVKNRASKIFIS
jgi:hypothetical protein